MRDRLPGTLDGLLEQAQLAELIAPFGQVDSQAAQSMHFAGSIV